MATLLLALAIVFTGLYAGFMLTFQISVMPALARLSDDQFLPAMRRINEVVPRPVFLLLFIGIIVFPAAALAVPVDGRTDTQLWLIVAGLGCAVVNHLITIVGNIPLNNALAAAENASPAAPDSEVRAAFERRWNLLHLIRTLFTLASFALLVGAALQ
ncbi:DUF1772 domain-containing protein [Streptomyces sp. NPDC002870]|uniref:anthrone oxygenase family protein n=1 Tax=Streptomyces sp. NPDC002870 TaxID=3364666 RepID=UPI0036903D8B